MYFNHCIEIFSLCLLRFENQDPRKKCMSNKAVMCKNILRIHDNGVIDVVHKRDDPGADLLNE